MAARIPDEIYDPRMKDQLRFGEFVALMAVMVSLVALSIDAMLPALPHIGQDLNVPNPNDPQLVVSALFFGLAAGQTLYGPLSDSIGRKPAIYIGLALFVAGCLMSMLAESFLVMLWGRVLQGFGVAAPRVVTLALVRDLYEGNAMARVMSFVMSVFILVPTVAPAMGQGILLAADWRAIFGVFLFLAVVIFAWFAFRQRETLTPDKRVPFSVRKLITAVGEICTNRTALGYTVTAGLIFGAFVGYLNSAQQIFQDQYNVGRLFPVYFGVLALAIGSASIFNGRMVMKLGMRWMSYRSLLVLSTLSILAFVVAYALEGKPSLWLLMTYLLGAFFCTGIMFGNLNALAMEPLGHIAGVGAAVVGSLSTFISVPLGVYIGASYDGTVLPLIAGFAVLCTASLFMMRWIGSPA